MNDKINIDNSLNAFDQKAKTMLENHQLPVDESIWNEIEAKLQKHKRRAIPFWFWLSGGAVAVIALLFMLRPLAESGKSASLSSIKQKTEKKTTQNPTSKTEIHKIQQVIDKQTATQGQSITNTEKQQQTTAKDSNNPVTGKTDSIRNSALELTENVATKTTEKTEPGETTENEKKQKKTELLADNQSNQTQLKQDEALNKNFGWQIAALFGSSDGAPSFGSGELYAVNAHYENAFISNSAAVDITSKSANYTRMSYSTPLSFGLLLRKDLDKTISLESGLVYTFIETKMGYGNQSIPDDQLNLHYLGVPLNLVIKLLNSKKWELYISGGGMLEKGLQSVYTRYTLSGSQYIRSTVTLPIDGFQWSLNSSIGTTYKFSRKFGLFFEPKISYYFKNNQPTSIRTDQPTTIGITGGIRYTIN